MRRKGLGEAPPASRRFFPDVSRLAPGTRCIPRSNGCPFRLLEPVLLTAQGGFIHKRGRGRVALTHASLRPAPRERGEMPALATHAAGPTRGPAGRLLELRSLPGRGPRSLLLPTVLGEHSTVAGPGLSSMRAPLRLDDRSHLQPRPPLHRLPVATAGLHASLVVLSLRRPLAGRHSDVQVP